MKRITLSAFILTVFLTPNLFASTVQTQHTVSNDAVQKCVSETCRDKFKTILKFAHNGNPSAQVLVATAYLTGDGLEQNSELSAKWLRRAVRQGSTKATWMLSNLYKDGIGVEQDTIKAENLLSRAVKREYGPALFQTAMQTFDMSSDSNKKEIELLERAKSVGYKPAIYLLAKMYETGTAIEKDSYKSAVLYNDLKFSDYKDSQHRLEIVKESAKKTSPSTYNKITNLDDDTEIITIVHQGFDYDLYLDYAIKTFRDERSIYDGKGGMSHIRGRTCGYSTGCRTKESRLDIAIFFGRH
ncbi:tetratricopeptide repeat protein [Thalassotalea nanhaiensis]|uniref:Tetratricopeptide repeat protein n=1 Tax=Thalassotalea nanhaiensis TaxID=3065648 RepID=A0ABY9TF42_9GAMM|nr:tetratricopeptide repeat protein [Colwelliaceae bacterium SQ345]